MIKSKHITLVRSGLSYMLQVVGLFKDVTLSFICKDMIKLKVFGADKGVDLAR